MKNTTARLFACLLAGCAADTAPQRAAQREASLEDPVAVLEASRPRTADELVAQVATRVSVDAYRDLVDALLLDRAASSRLALEALRTHPDGRADGPLRVRLIDLLGTLAHRGAVDALSAIASDCERISQRSVEEGYAAARRAACDEVESRGETCDGLVDVDLGDERWAVSAQARAIWALEQIASRYLDDDVARVERDALERVIDDQRCTDRAVGYAAQLLRRHAPDPRGMEEALARRLGARAHLASLTFRTELDDEEVAR